jgi:hypothetical protein
MTGADRPDRSSRFPAPARLAMMACTTSGERKASERVIRIERSLQRSRTAIASVPAI